MKRMIMAVLAVLVLAVPVSAQDAFNYAYQNVVDTATSPLRMMGQNLCDSHRGTGDAVEASWCYGVVVGADGRVEGYNPNSVVGQAARGYRIGDMYRARLSQQYGSPYDLMGAGYGIPGVGNAGGRTIGTVLGGVAGGILMRNKGPVEQAAGVVLGGIAGNVIGGKIDDRRRRQMYGDSGSEDISNCVKRTAKEFKKAKVSFTADQVLAACGGGSQASAQAGPEAYRAPEPPPQSQTAPAPSARQTVERVERSNEVYVQDNTLCNDTTRDVMVYVNKKLVGRLAAGQVVSLSSLPAGKVQFHFIDDAK